MHSCKSAVNSPPLTLAILSTFILILLTRSLSFSLLNFASSKREITWCGGELFLLTGPLPERECREPLVLGGAFLVA